MNIREFKKDDFDKVVSSMCDAFLQEDLYLYFVQDNVKREKFLKKFMAFRLRYGLKKGRVFVDEDCRSVAIWIKPNQTMTPVDLITCGGFSAMLMLDINQRTRVMNFNSFADKEQSIAIKQPFWHLSPICVAPAYQHLGYGRALMQQGIEQIKKTDTSCFLETQKQHNVSFYENFGFQLKGTSNVPLSEICHYTMVYVNSTSKKE